MRSVFPVLGMTVVLFLLSTKALPQQVTVEFSTPYLASAAKAIIVDPMDAPLPGATVNVMGPKWKKVIESKKTNANGWFSFNRTKAELLWLEINCPGFQRMHVKLRIIRGRSRIPAIKMELAT